MPSLEHLQKSLTLLHRASAVPLSPEEAICALSDTGYVLYIHYSYIQREIKKDRHSLLALTLRCLLACLCSGSVGEVVAKLAELKFYKELQLVCRVMHVQGLVLQYVRGGERLFHPASAAASTYSSRSGSRTIRRSATVGSTAAVTVTAADYSGGGTKTVTFSDDFDASSADDDYDHHDHRAPQDSSISREDTNSSSKLPFFFNGRQYAAVEYVLRTTYTLS